MIIPRLMIGELVYSDTAARYAADLLRDVAGTLVEISGRLGDRAAYADRDVECRALADLLVVDMPALLAAADYCLWLRDHVLHEMAALCGVDLRVAEMYGDADQVVLYRMQQEPLPADPSRDPPASLVPLKQIIERCRRDIPDEADRCLGVGESMVEVVVSEYALRLEWMRESLAEARTALGRNRSGRSAALVSHVDGLSRWLASS